MNQLIAVVLGLLLTNMATFYFTSLAGAKKLAEFRAQVAAVAQQKETERVRIESESKALASKLQADLKRRELELDEAGKKHRAALVRLGGVVRDLSDLRRVLDTRSDAPPQDATPTVRSDAANPGTDLAGRLASCEYALTVSAETAGVNRIFHERALMARDACVEQYNDFRARNNQGD